MWLLRLFLSASFVFPFYSSSVWEELNLPKQLLEYHIRSNIELREKCQIDPKCPIKSDLLASPRCWGYEKDCLLNQTYSYELGLGKCNLHTNRPLVREASKVFFDQADFGYLRSRAITNDICSSKNSAKSSLRCSDSLLYCYAQNIFFDFSSFRVSGSTRYRNDIIHEKEIGGNCEVFDSDILKNNLKAKSYLQSWAHELEHFSSYDNFSIDNHNCDVIFERPTVLIKLDASINMYHHFCDFVNLFASQHLNNSFSEQIDIVWWDTHSAGFVDKFFGITWEAFSDKKPTELISLAGKRVCFRNVMLPLLARQRFGLFYNMPLTHGCAGSGLIHSFSQFILHRLKIDQTGPDLEKIRVTILQRTTKYRQILNIDELLEEARSLDNVDVKIVDYNEKMPFKLQLKETHNSDIFIGMHGSGLTHLLFLPDWAAVLEIYNCEDAGCYSDLSRLRGVKYFTWPKSKEHLIRADNIQNHPSLGKPHKKFANYHFDPEEFRQILLKMAEYVRRNPQFSAARRLLRRSKKTEL